MQFTFLQIADNAEGQLDSSISGVALSVVLGSGEGSLFPETINGSATSGGTGNLLNSNGIQALGVEEGMLIENLTDGSQAFVDSVSTNSITTTTLNGGSDNTWQNSDVWAIGRFVMTLNKRASQYAPITQSEEVLVKQRVGDTFTLSQRGYNGTSAQVFEAGDYVSLFVTEKHVEFCYDAIAQNALDIYSLQTTKADTTYVDAALASRNWKSSVRLATTGAVTLATALENGDTLDGVVLATGNRILVKDQAAPAENGIYTVNASGAPTRATDFDSSAEVTSALVAVESGTANADTVWMCTSDSPTIGSGAITFVQFAPSTTIASQGEAEAGSNNTKFMTPLRVAQAIDYQDEMRPLVTFGETIAVGETLYLNAADSKWYKGDANDTSKVRIKAVALEAGVANDSKRVAFGGVVTLVKEGGGSFTVNAMVYQSDTAGAGSHTPSATTSIPIGIAVSTTTVLLSWGKKIARGTGTSQSANGINNETITIGFRAETLVISGKVQSNGVNDIEQGMLHYVNGVFAGGFAYDNAGSVDSANIPSGGLTHTSGGKTSTLSMQSPDDTTFVIRTVNSGTPGGSSNINWYATGE